MANFIVEQYTHSKIWKMSGNAKLIFFEEVLSTNRNLQDLADVLKNWFNCLATYYQTKIISYLYLQLVTLLFHPPQFQQENLSTRNPPGVYLCESLYIPKKIQSTNPKRPGFQSTKSCLCSELCYCCRTTKNLTKFLFGVLRHL